MLIPPIKPPLVPPLPAPIGVGVLPWEMGGGGPNQSAILSALIASLGGWWWDGQRADLITIATGVSSWTDRVQGLAVTQGTTTKQPAYSGGIVTADGANDDLASATNPLNGASAYTMDVIGSSAAWGAGTPLWIDAGTAGGVRALAWANGATSGLSAYCESPGGTVNQYASGASSASTAGVYTFQCDLADGATASKPVLFNGTTLGGSRTGVGAVSGTFTTGGGIYFFSQLGGLALFSHLSVYGIVILPTVTAAQNAQRIALLRSIYHL